MGEHRPRHSHRNLFAAMGGTTQTRIRSRHVIERETEYDHTTAVYGQLELRRPHIRPQGNVVQDGLLHWMIDPFVTLDRPAALTGIAEHRGVFAGAVVVSSPGPDSRVADNLGAALGEWLLRPAGEVSLLEAEVGEHLLDYRDVFRLSAV
jgi:hypothetical protein